VNGHEATITATAAWLGLDIFYARCACGWEGGGPFLTEDDARQRHNRHARLAPVRPRWVYTDGGREAAGYRGRTGDCVIRAITLAVYPEVVADPTSEAAGIRYKTMYRALQERQREYMGASKALGRNSVRNGVYTVVYREMLKDAKWKWTPTKSAKPKTYLRREDLPGGRLIVEVNRHLVAVIDGTIYDQFDSGRDGTRPVYGFWEAPNA
jgi:hypothetical protein